MAAFTGTATNDNLVGTSDPDTFDLSQGGDDIASGLDGDDAFFAGAALTAADRFDGGAGNDGLILSGDYTSQLIFAPTTIQNFETIGVSAGFNYNLKLDDQNVSAGERLVVNASLLGSANGLTFDGSAETNGFFSLYGGAGNDVLTGGNTDGGSCDFFYLDTGGNDTANGLGGSDNFLMGGALNAADKINGGSGQDSVVLDGDYSAGVTFNATTMRNVEFLWLNGGHSYKLTTADSTVAVGQTLDVNFPIVTGPGITGPLGPGDHLYFDGSAETNGSFIVAGSPGSDTLIGGAKGDEFYSGSFGGVFGGGVAGGNDTMHGGGGDDQFSFVEGDFNARDYVDGGSGHDFLMINGDFSGGLTLSSADIKSLEQITILDSGKTARITTADSAVASGASMEVVGPRHSTLIFHGEAETNGDLAVYGGDTHDSIRTGAGDDWIQGGGGADRLRGEGGADAYAYFDQTESTSTEYDTINGFNARLDYFVLNRASPGKIDAQITHGTLSTATFDHDLAAAANAAHLHKGDAVIFTPTSGSLDGDTFLVVDQNGVAGYQASQDYVIRLLSPFHLDDLDAAFNFR